MWRAFFLACGIYACILGAECLVVDTFLMASEAPPPPSQQATIFSSPPPAFAQQREVKPPDWAPWSLLSTGAVVVLYSLTLRRP